MVELDSNIQARLVYDGKTLTIPQEAKPKDLNEDDYQRLLKIKGQLAGCDRENLCELAGRICYDSLCTGRNTEKYWEHIRQVGHLSVVEHARYTVTLRIRSLADSLVFLNRRGVWVSFADDEAGDPFVIRVTINLRTLLEWEKWTAKIGGPFRSNADSVGCGLYRAIQPLCPFILPVDDPAVVPQGNSINLKAALAEPMDNHERAVSLYLSGSRGFSHEQVRHRMSMSQRSTRYVDEDGSPWVEHPNVSVAVKNLEQLALDEIKSRPDLITDPTNIPPEFVNARLLNTLNAAMNQCEDSARQCYALLADALEKAALGRGLDKQTARKQARGAARGYLGNALFTEMIFTASVDEWRGIIGLRLHEAADAEIRVLYAYVLRELKKSQYAAEFEDMNTKPSPDGLGWVLA